MEPEHFVKAAHSVWFNFMSVVVMYLQGEMIYKTYSGEHTTVLTRDDSLCYKCIRNQMIWRRAKHKSEQDSKLITTLLNAASATEKTRSVCILSLVTSFEKIRSVSNLSLHYSVLFSAAETKLGKFVTYHYTTQCY